MKYYVTKPETLMEARERVDAFRAEEQAVLDDFRRRLGKVEAPDVIYALEWVVDDVLEAAHFLRLSVGFSSEAEAPIDNLEVLLAVLGERRQLFEERLLFTTVGMKADNSSIGHVLSAQAETRACVRFVRMARAVAGERYY